MELDLFSMIVGALLVVAAVWLYRQIQSGGIRVPPLIKIGPIRIDLSEIVTAAEPGVADGESPETPKREVNLNVSMPKLNVGASSSTSTSGWLAVLGAGAVLFGFIMPWFFCNIGFISGGFSGLTALIQLVWGIILAALGGILGLGNNSGGLAGLSIITLLLLLIPAYLLFLVPLSGWRIGRTGYRVIQGEATFAWSLRNTSKFLIRTATIGLIPMVLYWIFTATGFDLSALRFLGLNFSAGQAQTGLLLVMGGFGLAIVAGMMLGSVATAKDAAEVSTQSVSHTHPLDRIDDNDDIDRDVSS